MAGTARSVGDLIEHGYSVRDAAGLLNITAGRVSQLGQPIITEHQPHTRCLMATPAAAGSGSSHPE